MGHLWTGLIIFPKPLWNITKPLALSHTISSFLRLLVLQSIHPLVEFGYSERLDNREEDEGST